MKIIFLRGLPGCGKTTIAKKLARKFKAHLICVDKYKLEAKTGNFKTDCLFAYDKAIRELKSFSDKNIKYIIIDEIMDDKKFVSSLKKIVENDDFESYWFQIKRSYEDLLKTESERKRKIKNSLNDLKKLQSRIEKVKIKKEVIMKNNDLLFAVNKIIDLIK